MRLGHSASRGKEDPDCDPECSGPIVKYTDIQTMDRASPIRTGDKFTFHRYVPAHAEVDHTLTTTTTTETTPGGLGMRAFD